MSENEKSEIKNWQLVVIGLIIVFAVGLKLYYAFYYPKVSIKVNDKTLDVLVANNLKHWQKGLGGRNDLGKFDGMFFVFPEIKQHVFVMRDMKFPIDIIWFNKSAIVDIAPNVPIEPGVLEENLTIYPARDVSDRVLEMPAGSVEKYNFKIGDKLEVLH
ncbi:MAG: DUF192 domain-containing protein [Candidatus Magasanikbacteria bacterium]